MTLRACLVCGEPTQGSRCPQHRPADRKPNAAARGYDEAWNRLSRRARRMQPWCSDCGSTERLECDHRPSAWERKAQGLPLRLRDVDVCCGACNRARGAARGPGARWGNTPRGIVTDPSAQAKFPLHTPGGIE